MEVTEDNAHWFADSFTRITDNVGKFLYLGDFSHIEVVGDGESAYDEIRAIMMHLACFIDPSKLKITVLCSADRLGDWEWVKKNTKTHTN